VTEYPSAAFAAPQSAQAAAGPAGSCVLGGPTATASKASRWTYLASAYINGCSGDHSIFCDVDLLAGPPPAG
jgi:hypothetical protein